MFKKILILILIISSYVLYLDFKINSYDFKYRDGNMSGEFIVISKAENSEYYNKYFCKNISGDKFLLQINGFKLEVKNKVKLEGKFGLPTLVRNEGGFNYRRYLNSKGVYGIITVDSSDIELIDEGKLDFITKIKYKIEEVFIKILPRDYAGIINGMLNGDTKNVSNNILENFKDSGVTHLLAVSGSNIAYIIMFVSLSSNKIFGKYLSYYIIIISIIIFIFVSGASASVARAGIMAILNICAILLSRKSDTLNNIFISALTLLILNPLIIYDVGFILSFVGTLGIVLISGKIILFVGKIIKIKFIAETIGVTLPAQIMLLPIMAYYFHTVSLISLISNLVIVPISGFLTILGFITVIVGNFSLALANVIGNAIYALISFMFAMTSVFSNFPLANILVITPKLWFIAGYYLILYFIFCRNEKEIVVRIFKYKKIEKSKKFHMKIVVAFLLICFIISNLPRNYINLNMLDVGQGDSIYIETKNRKTILIDGGGSEGSDYDVGEKVVVPYILDKGKKKIDLIIVSHPHEDHIEGVITVVKNLKVKRVIISKNVSDNPLILELRSICTERNTEIIEVYNGNVFKIDDVNFEVIHPNLKDTDLNINNMSLIIKMKFGNVGALFTGDVETLVEENLNKDIKVDILKVAHHGSKTSSTEKFLKRVSPQIALISVGKNNKYGHPNIEVTERLEKNKIKVYRTDILGEIKLKIKKNKIYVNE